MHRVLRDSVLFAELEADLIQYYNFDIYDFIRGDVYVRRVISLMLSLPADSRFMKRQRNDPLDLSQHSEATIIEALNLLNFQAYYIAAAGVGKEWKKIFKKAPKPGSRPKYIEEEKPKSQFMTGRELKAMMGITKQTDLAHKAGCPAKDTDGVLCSCPPKSRRKPQN